MLSRSDTSTSRIRSWLPAAGILLAIALVSAAVAQTVEGLNIGAIREQSAQQQADAAEFVSQVLERGHPHEGEAEELRQSAVKSLSTLNPADLPTGPSGAVDFDALVAGAAANTGDMARSGPLFIVFASLSMPKEALASLIADTSRAGGVIAFRGFPQNSAKVFTAGIKAVVTAPEQQAHLVIDPRLFRAFGVKTVPTFVAVSSDFALCDGFSCQTALPPHDRMSGNVSVDYALEAFADARGPSAGIAGIALAQLRKRD